MSVYSRRLVGPVSLTGSLVVYLTVPADHTYVLQSFHIPVAGGVAGTSLILAINGTAAGNRVYRVPLTADTTIVLLEQRLVLEAGDQLYASANASVTLTVSGYDLEA